MKSCKLKSPERVLVFVLHLDALSLAVRRETKKSINRGKMFFLLEMKEAMEKVPRELRECTLEPFSLIDKSHFARELKF